MVRVSTAASADVAALDAFYVSRGRDEAILRLRDHIHAGCDRYEDRTAVILTAPRPYPELAVLGFRWVKEGPYWLAFEETARGVILARVFHQAADMKRRLRGR